MSETTANRWTTPAAAMALGLPAALQPAAMDLLKPGHSPKEFVSVLTAAGHLAEAVKLVPFALTPQEAVWWAAQCVRTVPVIMKDPLSEPALAAAEKWCTNPTDENRRAALTAAEATKLATAAGCVAMAVFLSGGSLAPATVKETVPPPPNVAQSMIGNAVLLAGVTEQPELSMDKYTAYLALAESVAVGANRWPRSTPAATGANPGAAKPAGVPKEFPPYPTAKR